MNLRDFTANCKSPDAKKVDLARAEFNTRQELSSKLARRLRRDILTTLEGDNDTLQREDHFYRTTPEGERFFAFVTPISSKRFQRLAHKLSDRLDTRDHIGEDDWWWHAMDLARFRIVTANLWDLVLLRTMLYRMVTKSSPPTQLRLRDPIRDFIWSEPNRQHNASKSLHFRICGADHAIVEVQIMTLLQYSWDQIQHWLYERDREKGHTPTQMDKNVERSFWALSNTLFVLDEYIVLLSGTDPRILHGEERPDRY